MKCEFHRVHETSEDNKRNETKANVCHLSTVGYQHDTFKWHTERKAKKESGRTMVIVVGKGYRLSGKAEWLQQSYSK